MFYLLIRSYSTRKHSADGLVELASKHQRTPLLIYRVVALSSTALENYDLLARNKSVDLRQLVKHGSSLCVIMACGLGLYLSYYRIGSMSQGFEASTASLNPLHEAQNANLADGKFNIQSQKHTKAGVVSGLCSRKSCFDIPNLL